MNAATLLDYLWTQHNGAKTVQSPVGQAKAEAFLEVIEWATKEALRTVYTETPSAGANPPPPAPPLPSPVNPLNGNPIPLVRLD